MIIASNSQLAEPLRKQKKLRRGGAEEEVERGGLANCDTSREENLPNKRKEGRQASKQARTAKLPEKENRKKLTKSTEESKQTERPRERERVRTELAKLLFNRWM